MSETENPNRKSPVVDADFDEPDLEAEATGPDGAGKRPPPEPPPKPPGRGASSSVAWLALLLALAALAGTGYVLWQDFRAAQDAQAGDDAVADLRSALGRRIDETNSAVAKLGERTDALEAGTDTAQDAIDALESDIAALDDKADLMASAAPRIASLEKSLANLQGISVEARSSFLLAEAEYYMQIANAQLQLAGNPELAALALQQADDRLGQVGDPALTEVRRALADERAALDVMVKPDIAGVTLTLGSLAQVVDSLPVRNAAGTAAAAGQDAADEPPGALARAWASVKGAFRDVFEYTPPTDADRPLLTPGSEPLLRGNLALQLQAARLALLRGEQDLFRQSLDDADQWLVTYFDTSATPVASARQTIADIRDDYQQVAKPDISGSLRLLRQYESLEESAQ